MATATAESLGAGAQELVQVDELGTAQPNWSGETVRTFAAGLTEAALARLAEAGGYELTEDVAEADLAVVSTRPVRGELQPLLASLRGARCRIVALVHTGGESAAVEVMRAGGAGVVAEGNEESLRAVLEDAAHDTSLVDTYDRQIGQSLARAHPGRSQHPITHLPGRSALNQRLADLVQSGDVPRVGFLRVLYLPDAETRLSEEGAALLRRRLGVQFRQLTRAYDVELYDLGEADFAVVGPALSPNNAEQLGLRLAQVTETFAPLGNCALGLAMGHAGAEVTQEAGTLFELAQRALEVAALEKQSTVVSADTLSLGVSSTTELEAAMRMVAFVEQSDPYLPGHGTRVAQHASELAWQLGYEGLARTRVQLAGLLHDTAAGEHPSPVRLHLTGNSSTHLHESSARSGSPRTSSTSRRRPGSSGEVRTSPRRKTSGSA